MKRRGGLELSRGLEVYRRSLPASVLLPLLFLAVFCQVTGCQVTGNSNDNDNSDPDAMQPVPVPVTVVGNGEVDQSFAGAVVTLTAIPDEGWAFTAWAGTTTSRRNPLTLIYSETVSLSVVFVESVVDAPDDPDDTIDLCPDDPDKTAPGVCGCGVADSDDDDDGLIACQDNCPNVENADQADTDGDGIGNVCDDDDDNDGVIDPADRCADSIGAVDMLGCSDTQVDGDGDGICNPGAPSSGPSGCTGEDNCPQVANPDQSDVNNDGKGDACDLDDDEDGVLNVVDLCPSTAANAEVDDEGCSDAQVDADADGACDVDAPSAGPSGCTGTDNCPDVANTSQVDFDGDGDGDACDDDDDDDGIDDVDDLCVQSGSNAVVDVNGCSDAQVDPDDDGICSPSAPSAGPSACTGSDNCPAVANPDQADSDSDGQGDACEGAVCGDGQIEAGEECDPPCNECDAQCMLTAPATTATWTAGTGVAPDGALLGVWGSGPDDVFLVGGTQAQGEVFHYDGTNWTEMTVPAVPQLIWSFGFASDDVYAVGITGTLIRYDGNSWSAVPTGRTENLWGIWGDSPTDMWIVGGNANTGNPLMLHYDGQGFTPAPVILDAGQVAHTLFKVWGSGGRTFAVGQNGLITEYDGQDWRQVPSGATQRFISLWGTSSDNVVAVGGDFAGQVAVFDGTDWTTTVDFSVMPLNAVFMTHPDRAVIAGVNGYKGSYNLVSDTFVAEDFNLYPPIHAMWSDCDGRHYAVGGMFEAPYNGFYLVRTTGP